MSPLALIDLALGVAREVIEMVQKKTSPEDIAYKVAAQAAAFYAAQKAADAKSAAKFPGYRP